MGAFTLRDEALGVVLNVSMFITVRGVAVRVERRVPSRGIGAKDTVLGADLSAVLVCSLGSLIVMRGMVVGAGGLSVKTSATCTSASCWRGVNLVSRRSLRGSLRILLRSSIVAWRRSSGVATGSASLPGIHVTALTMRIRCLIVVIEVDILLSVVVDVLIDTRVGAPLLYVISSV